MVSTSEPERQCHWKQWEIREKIPIRPIETNFLAPVLSDPETEPTVCGRL